MGSKKCSKCGEVKDLSGFAKNKGARDGLGAWCRACTGKYRAENKDKAAIAPFVPKPFVPRVVEKTGFNKPVSFEKGSENLRRLKAGLNI